MRVAPETMMMHFSDDGETRPDSSSSDRQAAKPDSLLSGGTSRSVRKIRLLLAEDHALLRQALAEFLQLEPDLEVVAEANSGLEAVALAQTHRPDVILMDFALPDLDGAEATRRIVAALPHVLVIGLSMHEKDYIGRRMETAGVAAYVTKGESPEQLVQTIRRVVPAHPVD